MARVTVEDCVEKVPNRFELVALAARRSRELALGAPLSIARDRDKNPVVALREIAEGTLTRARLYEAVIHSMQRHAKTETTTSSAEETQYVRGASGAVVRPGFRSVAVVAADPAKGSGEAIPVGVWFEDADATQREGD